MGHLSSSGYGRSTYEKQSWPTSRSYSLNLGYHAIVVVVVVVVVVVAIAAAAAAAAVVVAVVVVMGSQWEVGGSK
jgi:hypothetical protein